DTDKNLAPQLANAITDKLQAIHQDIQNSNNISSLKSLQSGKEKMQTHIDSISRFLQQGDITSVSAEKYMSRRTALAEPLQQYEKLIGQYQLMVDNNPPVLVIVERARPASWPDKPAKLPLLIGTLVLSFLFSSALALF